jgi:hypothetical protein
MNTLPKDPIMLLSFINMKLRDFYKDLDALCEDMDIPKDELVKTMKAAGFEYSEDNKRFW